MNEEMKKVPTVRFKGFTDDWEQQKFGDIFKEYSDKGHEELPALTIIQGHGTIPRNEADRNMVFDKNSLNNYKLVNKSDFIVHLRSFEGGLEVANSQGIVSPAYHVFHGEKADTKFYYPYFRSFNFINAKLKPFVYGIRDGRSIDIQGMKKALIPYPSCDEQKKVGKLLTQIDDVFKLHQHKLDQLQTLKKYFLQNMFPAKGEKIPAIRFSGFTGDWEKYKLSDFATFGGGHTPSMADKSNYDDNGILWVTSQDVKVAYLSNTTTKLSKKGISKLNLYPKGTLLIVTRSGILRHTLPIAMLEIPATVNQDIRTICIKKGNSPYWLMQYLKANAREILRKYGKTGTTVESIDFSKMKSMSIRIPKFYEQQKIGAFFVNIDHDIAFQQRKLDQLQSLKKFMLQNLFI